MEHIKRIFLLDHQQNTVGDMVAKIIAGWTALLAGIKLGDLATAAALIYTVLNIAFLLYDRIIRPRKESQRTQVN